MPTWLPSNPVFNDLVLTTYCSQHNEAVVRFKECDEESWNQSLYRTLHGRTPGKLAILNVISFVTFYCSVNIREQDNLVSSTGLIMWIGHRKRDSKADVSSVSPSSERIAPDSLRRRANARNVSFRISLRWPIHIINPVDETKLSCYTSHRRSTTVSLETYPSNIREQFSFELGGGGGTPLYGLNRYVRPEGVWFSSRLSHK